VHSSMIVHHFQFSCNKTITRQIRSGWRDQD
jgi:hypothetical protein